MRAHDIRSLVNGLASCAVAALSVDPGAAAFVVLSSEIATAVVERRPASQRLQRTLTEGLTAWAKSEKLDEALEPGMEIAISAIKRHGLLPTHLRACSFDVDRITAQIITRSRVDDQDWGIRDGDDADEAHTVARRAIRTTVALVLQERHSIESEVLPVLAEEFAALDNRLSRLNSSASTAASDLQELTSTLADSAGAEELRAYLVQRVDDWDAAGWIQSAGRSTIRPSQIERTLDLQEKGTTTSRIPTAQALQRHPHLVILGGPGSGKSWLAKKIARDAAMKAIEALDAGADPAEVEIPVFTTWDAWTKQSAADPRQALIEASFAAGLGHSDLGSARRTERIKRLLGSTSFSLAVVDSLDEASNRSDVESRMHELHRIQGWRTVVTSRPSAWTEKRALREQEDGVAEIEPLSWKTDVPPFVRGWFADDPERSAALTEQLLRTEHLRQTSTIPLLLSFYCLFAQASPPDAPLPTTDHELFEKVIHELLTSEWAAGERPQDADVADANQILARWAWESIKEASAASGLGRWGERLHPRERVPGHVMRILDNVAPAAVDAENRQFRSFRHHTLLEHFVAVHIAGFTPEHAAEALLPHLWFDPDWEITAPRAIALHPERDEVRTRLLESTPTTSGSSAMAPADAQIDAFWARVLADTAPDDWAERHRREFHRLRIRLATERPTLLVATAQWTESDHAVVEAITKALVEGAPRNWPDLERLVRALPPMDVGSPAREVALHAVTTSLVESEVASVEDLGAFFHLEPTSDECTRLCEAILATSGTKEPGALAFQIQLLSRLDPSPDQRRRGRKAIIEALTDADPWSLADLVEALSGLEPSPLERRRVCSAITTTLSMVDPWRGCILVPLDPERIDHRFLLYAIDASTVTRLASTLVAFDSAGTNRDIAVQALLLASTSATGDHNDLAVATLAALSITDSERRLLRAQVASALSTIDSWGVGNLARALVFLDPTSEERMLALAALNAAFSGRSEPWHVGRVVEAFEELSPSGDERRAFKAEICAAFADHDPLSVGRAIDALASLDPTPEERTAAVRASIAVLVGKDSTRLWAVASSLPRLQPGPEDRVDLCAALTTALAADAPSALTDLVQALSMLEPDEDQRAVGFRAITKALGTGTLWNFSELMASLMRLIHTEKDQQRAFSALSDALATTDPRHLRPLTEALLRLATTTEHRSAVFRTIIEALATVDSQYLRHLAGGLIPLASSDEDRRASVAAVVTALPRAKARDASALVATVRRLSTPEDWLHLLRRLGQEPAPQETVPAPPRSLEG